MMKLKIIIEKGEDGSLFGRIEDKGNFMPVTAADSTKAVVKNIKMLIQDYVAHEGKTDPFWAKLSLSAIRFEMVYEV